MVLEALFIGWEQGREIVGACIPRPRSPRSADIILFRAIRYSGQFGIQGDSVFRAIRPSQSIRARKARPYEGLMRGGITRREAEEWYRGCDRWESDRRWHR